MAVSRNTVTIVAGIKLVIFVMASLLVTGTLVAIMGSFSFGSQSEYKAMFTSASLLAKGDDVRVAGVTVGEVKKVEIVNRNDAEVTFKIKSDVPMTRSSRAEIRFLNLVGSRYLALDQGKQGAAKLPDGAVIPKSQTQPALNLTELFNGFQPLFQALQPAEVNDLSMNLIKVLQGEGGTIGELMSNTASLTNALADRDQLIGDVIDNLSTLLKTVDDHHNQLNSLVIQLKDWLGNVAKDRKAIGDSVSNLSTLTASLADLLTQGRPYLKADVAQLRRTMAILNKPGNQKVLDEVLNRLPVLLTRQTRTGTYGSWYNYYLCDFDGAIILPDLPNVPGLDVVQKSLKNLAFHSTASRCKA
ncbi:MAG: virulence factor Mce [Marmoricola sp.]|jgi:phospholipid/cholesterol/gamma-HCH transport system substrate-binding protein|nr:virulence factor Mce [Marmoricola sp.]